MAGRHKKGLQDSIDDLFGDLLGDGDISSSKPQKKSSLMPVPAVKPRSNILSDSNRKSLLDEDYLTLLEKEMEEESDVSEVDAEALLENLKDIDDMDAEMFGFKKPKSAPAKNSGLSQSTDGKRKPEEAAAAASQPRRGHSAPEIEKKPLSAPVAQARPYKKFSFDDDSVADLLSEDIGIAKKTKSSVYVPSPDPAPVSSAGHAVQENEKKSSSAPEREKKPLSVPSRSSRSDKKPFSDLDDPLAGLLSDDDNDEINKKTKSSAAKKSGDTGHPSSPARTSSASHKKEFLTFEEDSDDLIDALGFGEGPQTAQKKESTTARPARSKLDELMGRGTAAKLLERPPTGEKKEFKLDPKYQKPPDKEEILGDEDVAFGSYQPSMISSPEGRQSRRSSVRFSAESNGNVKFDAKSQPTTPKARSPAGGERNGADWLGLKDDDVPDGAFSLPLREPTRSSTVTPASRPQSGAENGPTAPPRASKVQAESAPQEIDEWLTSALSKKSQILEKVEEKPQNHNVQVEPSGRRSSLRKEEPQKVPVSSVPASRKEEISPRAPSSVPPELPPDKREEPVPARLTDTNARDNSRAHEPEESRSRVLDLEAQVRKHLMEKEQQHLLLETLQQRHKEDLELIENAHRNRLKLLEDSARQREERLCQENRELSAQYVSQCQAAEREKAATLAQYQKKLTEFQQEKESEVARIRELQRTSVKEMCKDYEEQLQRVKRLKDQEIDAVTSASSETRSLNGVIEQMESFFHKLGDLSEKVEQTQVSTSQELEISVRQREAQLKALQGRLSRQQKDMEEEKSSLHTIITNMETRLSEQSRLLEQERWKASAEQAKVESLQRSLEEQRRVMAQQMSMERDELDRAKSALLEEQQSVMRRCAEERQKLAVEWSEFHTQHKLSKEQVERDANRALMLETQREGTIISLAKEQADLKVQAGELRVREEQLASAKETLETERRELRLEKERVNALALRVQHRAEEIEHMSKLASQRYEEGEKSLEEAKKVESEHHSRLKAIQQKLNWLRQEEERIHQQRLNLASQRRQLEKIQQGLPTASALFPSTVEAPHLSSQLPGLQRVGGQKLSGGRTDFLRVPEKIQQLLVTGRVRWGTKRKKPRLGGGDKKGDSLTFFFIIFIIKLCIVSAVSVISNNAVSTETRNDRNRYKSLL
uniref:Fas binding factor 1 n=1 Tax=Leptobrachium leishanense TaxID=445787 RepID=A0A8C5RCU8_9ANUR